MTEGDLAGWLESPPETITYFEKNAWGRPGKGIAVHKPADFDPEGFDRYRRES